MNTRLVCIDKMVIVEIHFRIERGKSKGKVQTLKQQQQQSTTSK
jgi:hypothetical protein